jgi:hypothetical protein
MPVIADDHLSIGKWSGLSILPIFSIGRLWGRSVKIYQKYQWPW